MIILILINQTEDMNQQISQVTQRQCNEVTAAELRIEQPTIHAREKPRSNAKLFALVLLCLFVVVLANYQFYFSVKQTVQQKEESQSNAHQLQTESLEQRINAKLKALEDAQAKILQKNQEIKLQIDVLEDQLAKQAKNNVTQESLRALASQIDLLKSQFAESTKKAEEQATESMNQMKQLKGLIKANQQTKSLQLEINKTSEVSLGQENVFDVPKKLWIFKENSFNYYVQRLTQKNNIDFAKDSGFEVTVVDRANFASYVPKDTAAAMEAILQLLQKSAEVDFGLRNNLKRITKTLVLLNVLNENGGLFTNGEFAITQDLSWLRSIGANPYANRGNRGAKPQVVGFYSFGLTAAKQKENLKPFAGMEEVDKFMNVFPVMEDYFVAAYKRTEFLTKLIQKMYEFFRKPLQLGSLYRSKYIQSAIKGINIYDECFFITVQMVLQEKQREIDSLNIDSYRHFAIDYFGLNLINCLYGPFKFSIIGDNHQIRSLIYFVAKYSQEEFYAYTGPMLYIAKITPIEQLNAFIEEVKDTKGKGNNQIIEGSFLHRVFFSHSEVDFISKRKEKPFVNETNVQWMSLPKIIWVFWNQGIANSKINNQICVQSMRRMAALSGYKVNEVSLANAAEYIGADLFQRIQTTFKNTKLITYPTFKSDCIRLALLIKHGGIYMDASIVPLQTFNWVINIGRHPSQFIFNRFGELPKVLLAWHPFVGGEPGQFTVSQKYNTKSQWHLGYETSFIAAQKGSELMKDWLQQIFVMYSKEYSQVDRQFNKYRINRWNMNPGDHYMVVMETLKYVIARKQFQIEKSTEKKWESASEYYKIWSYSAYLGVLKFRDFLSLQNPHSTDNPFIYRYPQSYVQGIVGKPQIFVKFSSPLNKQLNRFIEKHTDGKFESEAHSQSFFMRHIWNSSYSIERVGSQLKLRIRT